MRIIDNLNIDFIAKRKIAYIISSVLLLLGIISLFVRGLELGIDFKGGTDIALKFQNPVNIAEIRDDINSIGIGNVEIKTFGGDDGIIVRTELQEVPRQFFPQYLIAVEKAINDNYPDANFTLTDSTNNSATYEFETPDLTDEISAKLLQLGYQSSKGSREEDNLQVIVRVGIADLIKDNLRTKMANNPFEVQKEDLVGPKVGNELKRDTIIAIVLALIVILIYLGFRFKFVFALGAVAALFHDVMITLGVFSLLYGVIPGWNLEISISVVAAFLTLVGYSINDTVVVFDRVRENFKIHKTAPVEENINKAINKTMRRTIITSFTTLMVITVLLFGGGEVLRGFAFTLFFGIIVGTYSSIFVASSFVFEYANKRKKKIQF